MYNFLQGEPRKFRFRLRLIRCSWNILTSPWSNQQSPKWFLSRKNQKKIQARKYSFLDETITTQQQSWKKHLIIQGQKLKTPRIKTKK